MYITRSCILLDHVLHNAKCDSLYANYILTHYYKLSTKKLTLLIFDIFMHNNSIYRF